MGKVVPVEITVGLIKNAMVEHESKSGARKFILDAFPRNSGNVDGGGPTAAALARQRHVELAREVLDEDLVRLVHRVIGARGGDEVVLSFATIPRQ